MEAQALIKALQGIAVEVERVRLSIVSRSAKLEEFNQKTRHMSMNKSDPFTEMAAQSLRKEMRELLKEVVDLASKFEMMHVSGSAKSERLTEVTFQTLATARNFFHTLSNLSAGAFQAHNILRSSSFGVLGWNIQHDAEEAEAAAGRIVKICQRLSSATQIEG